MSGTNMNFLKEFEKSIKDVDGIGESSTPPKYWRSMGNYVLNKIMSGSVMKGLPQGRVVNFSGSSGSGKSFLAANAMKNAQDAGDFILCIDSENALDDEFVQKIGVDTTLNYKYISVTTIPQVTSVISAFLKGYKKEFENVPDAPGVFIVIDSLDMLMTDTELEHYDNGIQKGDQGQRNKQLKAMLRTFVQAIKKLNVIILVTSQVYKNQDVKNGEGVYMIADSVKYSASQILLISKLKLKEGTESIGVRIKCEGYKTRHTKPFQVVTIEVPYETGMDPHSGLVDVAKSLGILVAKGSRVRFANALEEEKSWYASEINIHATKVIEMLEEMNDLYLKSISVDDEVDLDDLESTKDTKEKRKAKVGGTE